MNNDIPSVQNAQDALRARQAFSDLHDHLLREGIEYQALIAGAGMMIAESIINSANVSAAVRWFATQAGTCARAGTAEKPN